MISIIFAHRAYTSMKMYSQFKQKISRPDLGLFVMRLVLGIIFVAHGWSKLQNMEGTIGFFQSIGLSSFVAYAVALIEFLGGLSMILGVGTAVFGVLLAAVMVGAIVTVKSKGGLTGPGGFELDLGLLAMAIGLAMSDPGRFRVCGGTSCTCVGGVCKDGCGCGCHGKCDNCDGCKNGCTKHEVNS